METLRIVLYDYETEKVRSKTRKNLKKIGLHVQWSVFETIESLAKIEKLLYEEGENFRVAVFKINQNGKIRKIGENWEKIKFVL